ncbi:hypothetical protein Sjap_016068 [Stephania japonica]|uniref:Uncharacterized protein n=1 Tax=Stephania japonica TaxID=461633 RepID=A0AAP0ILY4_9MAGN
MFVVNIVCCEPWEYDSCRHGHIPMSRRPLSVDPVNPDMMTDNEVNNIGEMTKMVGHMRYQHHNNITLKTRVVAIGIRRTRVRVKYLKVDSLEEWIDIGVIGVIREENSEGGEVISSFEKEIGGFKGVIKVVLREYFHPTYACPCHPRYGNHHYSSYASPQPDFYMSRPSPHIPQQEQRTIEDIEKDMIFEWLSPNMNLTEQELDQWIEQRDQEAEEEIKSILQKKSAETMSAIPLESVEVNEVTPVENYWSEPEETIKVSLHEPNIIIAQNEADKAEKEIYVILGRPEEHQKESKED